MMLRAEKKRSKDVSLNEPIGTDKEGNTISLIDVVENDEMDTLEQIEKSREYQPCSEICGTDFK